MYNPEAIFWTEASFLPITEDDLDEIATLKTTEEHAEAPIEDWVFEGSSELESLLTEINQETTGMNERQVHAYVNERIDEIWPALLAALPAVVQMAPAVVGAVSSLFSKASPPPRQQAPQPQVLSPQPPRAATPPRAQPVTATVRIPTPIVRSQPPAGATNPTQIINAFAGLIQSPAVQQLINNLVSGVASNITTASGQQLGASNILGVLSSLSGSLASNLQPRSTDTYPEYITAENGQFLIDPQDAVQEAELILDLINYR